MSNFWQRAITGTIFVVVLIGAIVLGGWYMHITFGVIVVLGLLEFYKLFENTDTKPQRIAGTVVGTLLYSLSILSIYFSNTYNISTYTIGLILVGLILVAIIELFRAKTKPFENISVTVSGMLYIVLPFSLLNEMSISINCASIYYDFWPVLSIFILIWCNDTFAYLTGRLIGKHKLFERISPKKTWEGFIGGVIFSMIAGITMAYFLNLSYVTFATYAIVASVIGTLGDLVQSMLKRSVNVKDSGTILPGHGGILDRFDAVLFVVPVIFFLEKFIFVSYLVTL
jgi:phosphatidate cytidylyltransferase